jgi:endonuclease YncB( thermonuclease family)
MKRIKNNILQPRTTNHNTMTNEKNEQLNKCTNDYPLFSFNEQEKICKIVDVYDGDTFTACFYHGNEIIKYKCRSNGYDSPEMRPRLNVPNRELEKIKAKEAKQKFIEFSNCENDLVKVKFGKFDKYGRILAEVYNHASNKHVNQLMIDENYGYKYSGGTKKEFTLDSTN